MIAAGDYQDLMKLAFSAGSLLVTVYFWFVRVNRERPALGVYSAGGFEGSLDSGFGVWRGRLFVANRSILPTAIVALRSEVYWKGRWVAGQCGTGEGSDLPWNLPPNQVFPHSLVAVFDLGADPSLEHIYANRPLRFVFTTVEGKSIVAEVESQPAPAAAA